MSHLLVPISFGELLDKITILRIKAERIQDVAKQANVRAELEALEAQWSRHPASAQDIDGLVASLRAVNERLWVIEDDIRAKERAGTFDSEFIELARSVYIENDDRARLKRLINERLGSPLVEEKSYQDYGRGPA